MPTPFAPARFAAALLLAVVVGCTGKPTPVPVPAAQAAGPEWFEDVTDKMGLDFVTDVGPAGGKYPMYQSMAVGCALLDFDGDGRLDLFLLTSGGPAAPGVNRLFRQTPAGRFEDVTAGSGLGVPGFFMGVATGDVNNDGRPDLLVTEFRGARLYLNLGGGKFEDVSAEAGVKNPRWGSSAAFVDYDRDGWLDLMVVNYVDYDPTRDCPSVNGTLDYCSPKTFPGSPSLLFRNRGPAAGKPGRVSFEDVSVASGIAAVPGPGLGVVAADFTGDGWPDLFVANDGAPNRLWVNQKNGMFKDEALSRNVAYTQMGQAFAGMGVAVGDVDGDGLLDLYVTHLGIESNTLWKQGPRGVFRDRSAEFGLTATKWRATGFGTLLADFDQDGRPDLAVVNGRVARGPVVPGSGLAPAWEPYAERNQLLRNAGGGKFTDVSEANPAFCGRPHIGRGLAAGDIDGDGAVDLVTTSLAGRARVYRNVCPDRGHWLTVRAVEPKLNRDAYGAEVAVTAGGAKRVRLVCTSDSICSAGSPVTHFGLGPAATADAIDVTWPDGTRERFPGGPADQAVVVRKGEGGPAPQ